MQCHLYGAGGVDLFRHTGYIALVRDVVHPQFIDSAEYNRRVVQDFLPVFQSKAECGIIRGDDGIHMDVMIFELNRLIQLLEVLLVRITFPIHILRINHRGILRTFETFFNAVALLIRPCKALLVGVEHQHILRRRTLGLDRQQRKEECAQHSNQKKRHPPAS
ncbi:hypothetical protein D3C73_688400 [compost metagenome]